MTSSRLPPAELGTRVGQEIGTSSWITVGEQRIDEFAHCTEDHQWITIAIDGEEKPALIAFSQVMLMS